MPLPERTRVADFAQFAGRCLDLDPGSVIRLQGVGLAVPVVHLQRAAPVAAAVERAAHEDDEQRHDARNEHEAAAAGHPPTVTCSLASRGGGAASDT